MPMLHGACGQLNLAVPSHAQHEHCEVLATRDVAVCHTAYSDELSLQRLLLLMAKV